MKDKQSFDSIHRPAKPSHGLRQSHSAPPNPLESKKIGFVRRHKRPLAIILAILLISLSAYLIYLLLSPKVHRKSAQEIYQSAAQAPTDDSNKIFIPSAGIQATIAEGNADQLDKGNAWHRLPDRGDPTKGGNFIVTGHSFVWSYSPGETTKKSIFYSLSDAKPGDEVLVRWDKQVYKYTVTDKKTVKPTDVAIEGKSKDPVLTVYTCTPSGSADGRVVLVAKPKS